MIKKKILIISYFFPPFSEVGAVRVAKIVKYLYQLDWTVHVVCVLEKYYGTIGESYLGDVKNAKIYRTKRFRKFIPGLNEEGFYWAPYLFFKLIKVIKKHKPDIIYYSGGPFFHWIIAPMIKKITGVNFVLDLRDAFALNPYNKSKNIFSYFIKQFSKFIEAFAIKYSSGVIHVNEFAVEMYSIHYPKYSAKMLKFSNGYDPEDFLNIKPRKLDGFNIVYSGKFGNFRDPLPFFQAFKKIIEDNKFSPKDICFIWIGNKEKHIVDMIDNLLINEYVKYTGFLSYKENLEYINGSSLALLVAGNHAYEQTTKIFDYAALNKPILALISTDGFLKKELSSYGNALICKDPKDIYNAISYYINTPSSELNSNNNFKKFERKEIIKALNIYLNSIIINR